jgi:hypothetical protein
MPERKPSQPQLALGDLQKHWKELHQSDTEVWPQNEAVQQAWLSFHRGQFDKAVELGLAAGQAGLNVANKAQAIMARHLQSQERQRLALLQAVADRSGGQLMVLGTSPAALARAHFWRGHALAQVCQGMNVAKALALGLSLQARTHLELAVALAPHHADAHLALAGFHADLIDKVGPLIAQLSYGASARAALDLITRASALQARSVMGLVEQARALVMLQGEAALAQATALYEQATRLRPLDAAEQLEIELARAKLRD